MLSVAFLLQATAGASAPSNGLRRRLGFIGINFPAVDIDFGGKYYVGCYKNEDMPDTEKPLSWDDCKARAQAEGTIVFGMKYPAPDENRGGAECFMLDTEFWNKFQRTEDGACGQEMSGEHALGWDDVMAIYRLPPLKKEGESCGPSTKRRGDGTCEPGLECVRDDHPLYDGPGECMKPQKEGWACGLSSHNKGHAGPCEPGLECVRADSSFYGFGECVKPGTTLFCEGSPPQFCEVGCGRPKCGKGECAMRRGDCCSYECQVPDSVDTSSGDDDSLDSSSGDDDSMDYCTRDEILRFVEDIEAEETVDCRESGAELRERLGRFSCDCLMQLHNPKGQEFMKRAVPTCRFAKAHSFTYEEYLSRKHTECETPSEDGKDIGLYMPGYDAPAFENPSGEPAKRDQTARPTPAPTDEPTRAPTDAPTLEQTPKPTEAPSPMQTASPTASSTELQESPAEKTESSSNVGMIVGIIVGLCLVSVIGVGVAVFVFGATCFCCKKTEEPMFCMMGDSSV